MSLAAAEAQVVAHREREILPGIIFGLRSVGLKKVVHLESHKQPMNAELVAQVLDGAVQGGGRVGWWVESNALPGEFQRTSAELASGRTDEINWEMGLHHATRTDETYVPVAMTHLAMALNNTLIDVNYVNCVGAEKSPASGFLASSGFDMLSTGWVHGLEEVVTETTSRSLLNGEEREIVDQYQRARPSREELRPIYGVLDAAQTFASTALLVQDDVFRSPGLSGPPALLRRQLIDYCIGKKGYVLMAIPLRDACQAYLFVQRQHSLVLQRLKNHYGDAVKLITRPAGAAMPSSSVQVPSTLTANEPVASEPVNSGPLNSEPMNSELPHAAAEVQTSANVAKGDLTVSAPKLPASDELDPAFLEIWHQAMALSLDPRFD